MKRTCLHGRGREEGRRLGGGRNGSRENIVKRGANSKSRFQNLKPLFLIFSFECCNQTASSQQYAVRGESMGRTLIARAASQNKHVSRRQSDVC